MENSKNTFEFLSKEISLISSKIESIRIFSENEMINISVLLSVRQDRIEILFENVVEYSFYHNDKYIFYNVEDYKLQYIKETEDFYISFDPNPDTGEMDSKDNDFIKSKKIKHSIILAQD